MDWPILASNAFMAVAILLLVAAPIAGAAGGWRALPRPISLAFAVLLLASFAIVALSWRAIPGGIRAAAFGHIALTVFVIAFLELGRAARRVFADRLAAAMAGFGASVLLVAGIFALAPLTANISPAFGERLLVANPLVSITSAAGIDLFHLDTIYRTSPLAHRGVVVPAWTTACLVYAIVGLAAHGASRIRPWSPRT